MIRHQNLVKAVQGCIDCSYLYQDIRTIGIGFQHILNASHLALDPFQPVHQVSVFLFRPFLGFGASHAAARRIVFFRHFFFFALVHSFLLFAALYATISFFLCCSQIIYPMGVFVNYKFYEVLQGLLE